VEGREEGEVRWELTGEEPKGTTLLTVEDEGGTNETRDEYWDTKWLAKTRHGELQRKGENGSPAQAREGPGCRVAAARCR
jgi:hypothetical protein